MKHTSEQEPVKTHLSLRVSDLRRSIAFYEAFFGLPPHKLRPGYANFDLANPPLKLALTQRPMTPGAGNLDHLGLLVSDTADVEAVKQRLSSAGLVAFDEMDTTCCYAKQDKFWVHDPDGVEWEVYAITDDMLEQNTKEQLPSEAQEYACCQN
jgi:catechol 2,3-dioxygenase-like lactoylglutathione lyase family enzyme